MKTMDHDCLQRLNICIDLQRLNICIDIMQTQFGVEIGVARTHKYKHSWCVYLNAFSTNGLIIGETSVDFSKENPVEDHLFGSRGGMFLQLEVQERMKAISKDYAATLMNLKTFSDSP